jgi:hypothetical protein
MTRKIKSILPLAAVMALALPAAQASAAQKSKFRFEQATYVAGEDAGSVDVVVTRDAAKGKRSSNKATLATVGYSITGGTAASGSDYAAVASGTLTFNPTVAKQTVHVQINQDLDIEGLETIDFKLSNASRNALIARPNQASVLIADDDGPTQIGIVPAQQNVSEADGSASFFAVRSGAINTTSSVDYATADGTATQPSDYTEKHNSLSYAVGDVVKQIDVTINDDSAIENPETFAVDLSNVSGATLGNSHSTVTIVDNDAPPVFALDASSYSVNENGSIDVEVHRLGGIGAPVGPNQLFTVDFLATDGTATSPADYLAAQAPDNTLEFDPTDTAETITIAAAAVGAPAELMPAVALVDDSLVEGAEAFGLSLANASTGSTVGGQGSATVTINDNDVAAGQDNGSGSGTGSGGDDGSGSAGGTQGDTQVVLGARQSACGLTVKASKLQKLLKKKAVILKVRAGQACKLSLSAVVVELKIKKTATLTRALRIKGKKLSVTLKPGKAATVKVRFSKKALKQVAKALKARKKLQTTVTVVERDASSRTKKRTLRIKVRR